MIKRQVIKNTTAVVALISYIMGSVVSISSPTVLSGEMTNLPGMFYFESSGILCLLNSFVWIAAIFLLGLSLIGFFGILPLIYCKMYLMGFSVTAVAILNGQNSVLLLFACLPEIFMLFFVFSELGSMGISFSLYILQRLSLLPRTREQSLCPGEQISFKEYVLSGVISIFAATLLIVYENIVMVLF